MTSFYLGRKRPRATAAGILGVALSGVLLLCGAGSLPVKNLLPQGTMQGDLDAGGHNIVNANNVAVNWQSIDATMVNTVGTDGNAAFALVTGNNYVVDELTSGPFELALPDPATAANLSIRIRDGNNSIGTGGSYTITNDAGGSGNGFLWYASGETDLGSGGATQMQVGASQNYGEMAFTLGTDATPQSIWVANAVTANPRINCDLTSGLTVADGSSIALGNGPLRIVTDNQGTGGGTLHIPGISGMGDSYFVVIPTSGGAPLGSGFLPVTSGSGGINWLSYRNFASGFFQTLGAEGALNGISFTGGAITVTPQVFAGSFSGTGSTTTTFTVTIGQTMGSANYKVSVMPTSPVAAAPFYVSAKTTTTFTVTYLTGLTGTVAFDWSVFP